MKKYLKYIVIFCILIPQIVFSQNINLKFKGNTSDGKYMQLDSVKIENISRNWIETLVYPDTILSLSSMGIQEIGNAISNNLIAYPNPFNGTTSVFLTLLQSESIILQVYDLAGQRIIEKHMQVEAGQHHFNISLDRTQVYFLITTTNHGRLVQKLINLSSSTNIDIEYIGATPIYETQAKTQKLLSSKPFQIGDVLRMNGYVTHNGVVVASNEILQPQMESESFTLLFSLQNINLPTITTTTISNITDSSAVGGGNITDDGGAIVSTRGICWSTSHNPTTNNYHTIDGGDIGNFISNLTNLISNTTYYVRSYATNTAGTTYGNEVSFTTTATNSAPFSVSATRKVVFSPGNLQWSATNGSAGLWRFAPHQWDTIGADNHNISSTYTGWIDLFAWGTSGYDSKYPYMTSVYASYGNGKYDISNSYYDWGVYNAIYNPQTNTIDTMGRWRTLTNDEWNYLLINRATLSGIRYAKANVHGVNGLIIVPDNYSNSIYTLDSTNTESATYTSNIINVNDWKKMEAVGCVFLPAAGRRCNTIPNGTGSFGYYWSATNSYSNGAYHLLFYSNYLNPSERNGDGYDRSYGKSVRLVRDVE